MSDVLDRLAHDQASGCFWVGGRGGAGSVPFPSGGYGSGEALLGRVNSPGVKLTIQDGACTIESAVDPAPMAPPAGIINIAQDPSPIDHCRRHWVFCAEEAK